MYRERKRTARDTQPPNVSKIKWLSTCNSYIYFYFHMSERASYKLSETKDGYIQPTESNVVICQWSFWRLFHFCLMSSNVVHCTDSECCHTYFFRFSFCTTITLSIPLSIPRIIIKSLTIRISTVLTNAITFQCFVSSKCSALLTHMCVRINKGYCHYFFRSHMMSSLTHKIHKSEIALLLINIHLS